MRATRGGGPSRRRASAPPPVPPPRAVVVHALSHARAALQAAREAGVAVTLLSAPWGAASAGAGWFRAVVDAASADWPEAAAEAVLDCGDRPDLAQAALRHGLRAVVFHGPAAVRRKLEDIAAAHGARILRRRPAALDLIDTADPLAACRAWLAGR